jgi:hypothetical protein
VNKSNHVEKFEASRSPGCLPIRVKGVDHALYLIVAHTGRKRPLLLVTDCRPASPRGRGPDPSLPSSGGEQEGPGRASNGQDWSGSVSARSTQCVDCSGWR